MVKRKTKNKVRCEFCNRFISPSYYHGAIHTECVEPYVKKVMNRSIIVTLFDKPVKMIASIFLAIVITMGLVMAGTWIATFIQSIDASGYYTTPHKFADYPEVLKNFTALRTNSWLNFDGINDCLDSGNDIEFNFTGAHSISMWVRPDLDLGTDDLVSKYDASGLQYVLMYTPSTGVADFFYFVGAASGDNRASGNVSTNKKNVWHHVVGIYNGSDTLIYINNIKGSDAPTPIPPSPSSSNLIIGCRQDLTNHMPGDFDELRMYDRALTELEITEIYNAGLTQNRSLPNNGLALWYSFDEATGTTVYDQSEGGNNAI